MEYTTTTTMDSVIGTRRKYKAPTIKVMSETELLAAFQMTAAEICSTGCWWGAC
jgi:hypothetical protein